jgi:hypothetical protein
MKCRIKTAHGYLSFQPASIVDGSISIQYRDTPGAWEELDIEAWDYLLPVPPDPELPPATDYPYGIVPSPNMDYVYAIKQALIADGKNLSGPCGAFEICRNVAMGLRETGCGLLEKTSGNQCQQRSTDIVCYKDFSAGATRLVDILSDAGGANTPMWTEKGPEENVEMERWKDPALSSPTDGSGGGKI